MEIPSTQAELETLFHRARLEIASKLEDFDNKANAELARFQIYYDTRKRELAAGKPASLLDATSGWHSRNWWQDKG